MSDWKLYCPKCKAELENTPRREIQSLRERLAECQDEIHEGDNLRIAERTRAERAEAKLAECEKERDESRAATRGWVERGNQAIIRAEKAEAKLKEAEAREARVVALLKRVVDDVRMTDVMLSEPLTQAKAFLEQNETEIRRILDQE